jgi:pimeloyl-ACP methyl ester carboxylesterase
VTASQESDAVLQLPQEAPAPQTRLVELPGRGVTRVWECAGPPDAPVLMLIHGVTVTAELGIGSFVAVGYSMGGMIAQLVWRRHGPAVSGLVLCATARNVLGSPAEKLAALTLPSAAAAIWWNPLLQPVSAEILGLTLLGPVGDPATAAWARAQLRRTPLGTALSAVQAVSEFTSHSWISQVDVPAAVVITTQDRIVPVSRQRKLAAAIPGASVHELGADHAVCITAPQMFAQVLVQACWSVTSGPLAQPMSAG